MKITTRRIRLKELAAEVRTGDERALAELPAEMSIEFAKIFEAAGITAGAKGWTVERLGQVLASDAYKGMDRVTAQRAILALLAADQVQPEEIVRDAIARDRAIDAFELLVRRKMDERTAARQRRIEELDSNIQSLREELVRLQGEFRHDNECHRRWIERKADYERELARALNILMEQPVVTVTEINSTDKTGCQKRQAGV